MRYFFISIIIGVNLCQLLAQPKISEKKFQGENLFPIINATTYAKIFCDSNDFETVKISAQLLSEDIERVSGIEPEVSTNNSDLAKHLIIIGTIEKCELINTLSKTKKIDIERIRGKWEQFYIKTIKNPFPGVKQALVIAGSDRRGTAYGVFELSAAIGVSPWYWWADVIPEHKSHLHLEPVDYISPVPSVKYRGIFLNDEDWGLQPWAAKTFEPETGDIGPKTYAKIFELLLRLKANLIWPAMHPCTKAFYHYPASREVADRYGIIVGSSHAEPMLRNNVDEWDKNTMGEFNYNTNRETIYKYWEQRAAESKDFENIYTIGMRGVHDSGMEGVKSMSDKISLLQHVLTDQREILKNVLNPDASKVPQSFIPYKEVLEIYDNGLKLPEDITIVWPDDNYGYIQRLNNSTEQQRPGGSGVYYHLSYWGRPHDYLWLNSTHPMLVWEELYKAYQTGCDKIWVMNVGDIKPLEYSIQLALDMAYNIQPYSTSQNVKNHLFKWYKDIFGDKTGTVLEDIYWEYFKLAFERRPEFMGWSQTEPTRVTGATEYNHFFYNDEAQIRLDRYNKISRDVRNSMAEIQENRIDAYYQLVYYPIRCAALMNKKFLHIEKAYLYANQHRTSANDHSLLAKQAYDSIMLETAYFNEKLANGKWNHMMTMNPRGLPVFDCPMIPEWKIPEKPGWGISVEGFAGERPKQNMYGSRLPVFSKQDDKYFVDLFITGKNNLDWTASVSHPWIQLSEYTGTLKNEFLNREKRIWVSIDWRIVPIELKNTGSITFKGEDNEFSIPVTILHSDLTGFEGFLEMNRFVSIHAENFSRIVNTPGFEWQAIDKLGYTGNAMILTPVENIYQTITDTKNINAAIEYDFYTFSIGRSLINIYCLPAHALNNSHQMRIAVSVDENEPEVIDFRTFDRSETWKQNVLRNMAIIQSEHFLSSPGKHSLKIKALDPGLIIDRITIDFGGLKPGYSAVPETKIK